VLCILSDAVVSDDVFGTSRLVAIATEEAPVVVWATEAGSSVVGLFVVEISAATNVPDHRYSAVYNVY